MVLSSLFVASALTLRAAAFLVVPELNHDATVPGGIHHFDLHDAHTQVVNLKCAECPFAEVQDDGALSWSDSTPTYLALNFTLGRDQLLLNDKQVFPSPAPGLQIVQYRETDNLASPPLDFDSLLEKMPVTTDDTGSSLTAIRFTILDLGGIPITVDTVILNMITTAEGLSYLAQPKMETSPAHPVPWKECRREPQCIKALLMARVRWFLNKAKTGAKAAVDNLPFTKGCNGKGTQAQAQAPSKHPHHGDHHGNMRQGKFSHAFTGALHLIIVPALLGVLAGLVAIATGMLAGQLIVFVWLRHRRQTTRSGPSTTREVGDDMEKEALIVEDLPPQYEDGDHGVIVLDQKD
ncbi:hypothetical protein FQN54_007635 [Arachnomyces sp. PD_36]|nr:hypothetical protein FQN54_007635 [Arachnomyces sp. PD_36]